MRAKTWWWILALLVFLVWGHTAPFTQYTLVVYVAFWAWVVFGLVLVARRLLRGRRR